MTDWMDDWPCTGEDGSAFRQASPEAAAEEDVDIDAGLLVKAGGILLGVSLVITLLGPVLWVVTIALTLAAGLALLAAAPFLAVAQTRPSALILPFPDKGAHIHGKRGDEDATKFLDA